MKIKNLNNSCNAEEVLTQNGFKIISRWVDDNLFEKDGKLFKINHPVWNGKNVRIFCVSGEY